MLRKIVNDVDSKAFIIVNESVEVRGQGFKALNEDLDERDDKRKAKITQNTQTLLDKIEKDEKEEKDEKNG